MGTDDGEINQRPQRSSGKKVLGSLCGEVSTITEMIVPIIPSVESARPGGKSGINELCFLNSEIEKLKLLLQHLTESSSFYLAITGEAVILRCERRRNALHESLNRIRTMVPEPLASQVSGIVAKLRSAKFIIDPDVEDAGRGILSVLQQSNPSEEAEFKAFCNASLKLGITSPRSRLLEKRCIKRLLDKIKGSDPQKQTALEYLRYLFHKYEKPFVSEKAGQKIGERTDPLEEILPRVVLEPKNDTSADSPPKEFVCPLSSELMRDPVVISSGETYEREAIAKWFRDGNDFCPRTGKKLTNLAMVPNSCMKSLISGWCENRGIKASDPVAPLPEAYRDLNSWNTSTSCSIASVNIVHPANVRGRIADYDCSNVSILSADAGYFSDSSFVPQNLPDIDESVRASASSSTFNHDSFEKFFSDLSGMSMEDQAKAVSDFRNRLQDIVERRFIISGGFMDALVEFLKESYHLSRVTSLKIGSQMLLEFLEETWGLESSSISEEAYELLLSFLDSEIMREALMILKIISCKPSYLPSIAVLGIRPLLKTLDSGSPEVQDRILEILCNLSGSVDGKLQILSGLSFTKSLSYLSDGNLAKNFLKLLHGLCEVEEGKKTVTEAEGFVSSIAGLLDSSDREEQAHSVGILLSLCSSSSEYCSAVMKEGIIPPLVHISLNGNSQGREGSMKLLQVLRDFREEEQEEDQAEGSFALKESPPPPPRPLPLPPLPPRREISPQTRMIEKKQSVERKRGFFGKLFHSKQRSLALV